MIVRPLAYLERAARISGAFSPCRAAEPRSDEADAEIGRRIAEALGAGRGCDADEPDDHAELSAEWNDVAMQAGLLA